MMARLPRRGHRGHRARRGGGNHPAAQRGRRRLPGEAVLRRAPRSPDLRVLRRSSRSADPVIAVEGLRVDWPGGRPCWTAAASNCPAGNSTCSPTWPPNAASWSPGRNCSRGVAPVLRRRPDHRRAHLVAAAQTRRNRRPAALPAHGARRRCDAGPTAVRKTLALVSAAVTSMVAIAFLIPLAAMVRDVARDRAFSSARLAAPRSSRCSRSPPTGRRYSGPSPARRAGAAGQLAVYLTGPRPAGGAPLAGTLVGGPQHAGRADCAGR